MNTNRNLQLAEPSFPETELIRALAPVPELSAGFKSRVMAECSVSITSAAHARRWKIGSAVAAVCALGLLICVLLPDGTQTTTQPIVTEQEPLPSHDAEPSIGTPASSSQLAGDIPKPVKRRKSKEAEPTELIDGLNQRQQKILDAGMLQF